MGAIYDFMATQATDAMIPVLRGPVEEVLFDILDRKGVPSRDEFRTIREQIDQLNRTVRTLGRNLEKLQAAGPRGPSFDSAAIATFREEIAALSAAAGGAIEQAQGVVAAVEAERSRREAAAEAARRAAAEAAAIEPAAEAPQAADEQVAEERAADEPASDAAPVESRAAAPADVVPAAAAASFEAVGVPAADTPAAPVSDPAPAASESTSGATEAAAVCRVLGCDAKPFAKGLCRRHYTAWRRGQLPGY